MLPVHLLSGKTIPFETFIKFNGKEVNNKFSIGSVKDYVGRERLGAVNDVVTK